VVCTTAQEANHSPPPNAKVKNIWSYTSTPTVLLQGSHRNAFTLDDTPRFIRKFNKQGIFYFKIKLSLETWDNVFENDDINVTYNFFLNAYLRIFYSSFPLKKLITMTNGNVWITMGIRTSCKHKRELYLLCKNSNDPFKNSNDPLLKNYYKLYCRILSNVIREAKNYYFSKQIENSKNKIKTVWGITRLLTGIRAKNEDAHHLNTHD